MFSFPILKGVFGMCCWDQSSFDENGWRGCSELEGKYGSEQKGLPRLTAEKPHAPHEEAELVSFLNVHLPTAGHSYLIIIFILCGTYFQQGFLGQNYIE